MNTFNNQTRSKIDSLVRKLTHATNAQRVDDIVLDLLMKLNKEEVKKMLAVGSQETLVGNPSAEKLENMVELVGYIKSAPTHLALRELFCRIDGMHFMCFSMFLNTEPPRLNDSSMSYLRDFVDEPYQLPVIDEEPFQYPDIDASLYDSCFDESVFDWEELIQQ